VRAEARPEGVEAPAGLGCAWVGGGSGVWTEARPEGVAGRWCGLKPFLRTWKPLPGWGVRGWRWRRGGVRAKALPESVAGRWCGLKPVLRAWKPLPGWGVWVGGGSGVWTEARPEGVEAPAGLGCVGGGGVRADGD